MPDVLNMSDEDFLKQGVPDFSAATPTEQPSSSEPVQEPQEEIQEAPIQEPSDADIEKQGASKEEPATTEEKPADKDPEPKEPESKADPVEEKTPTEKESTETPTDYEGFYKKIMTPFKANGKMIELRSPEEAVQLMQMGANYTRKMQELAPHRKVLLMLENNGLLDEGKLSFLIDVEKKNPEAIKKLIKDANIDPVEIDTSVEPAYQEGNHRVSEAEVQFRTTLDDLRSTQEGMSTLQTINSDWDQASKEALWNTPSLMTIIHEQRSSGVYDLISSEVNRLRMMGRIPAETPFIHAYRDVGDTMLRNGALTQNGSQPAATPTQSQQTPVVQPKTPVATRVVAPKPVVTNNDKATAASSTRATPVTQKETPNYLAMSDEEFEKLAGLKV